MPRPWRSAGGVGLVLEVLPQVDVVAAVHADDLAGDEVVGQQVQDGGEDRAGVEEGRGEVDVVVDVGADVGVAVVELARAGGGFSRLAETDGARTPETTV
jgi:hypothetical protein